MNVADSVWNPREKLGMAKADKPDWMKSTQSGELLETGLQCGSCEWTFREFTDSRGRNGRPMHGAVSGLVNSGELGDALLERETT